MMTKLSTQKSCAVGVLALLVVTQAAFGQSNAKTDRYVVELRAGTDPAEVLANHRLAARHIYKHALNGFAAQVPPVRLQALANDPRVVTIAADQQVFAFGKPTQPPTPVVYPDLRFGAAKIPPGVQRVGARKVWETGSGVGVAVLDTGLDLDHPDLNISTSWRFVSPTLGATSAEDDAGHGTHVAGIIAAKENDIDVTGVAPEATLYAVKVLDLEGSGYDSDIISGLNWVVENAHVSQPPIRVINMSLGRAQSPNDSPMRTAIQNAVKAGVTVVASAGNEPGTEVSRMVPAGFPEVIAVASTSVRAGTSDQSRFISADTASYFTTDGKFNSRTGVGVAISAPGEEQEDISGGHIYTVGIESTALGGGTVRMSGTSMAAPHVTGVVALLLDQTPQLTPVEVKARIMAGDREGVAPLDSPTLSYTFDREREGILFAPKVLGY